MAHQPTIEMVIIGRQRLLDLLHFATVQHCAFPVGDPNDVDDALNHVEDLFAELLDKLPTEHVGLTALGGTLQAAIMPPPLPSAPELLDEVRSRRPTLQPTSPPAVAEAACDESSETNTNRTESEP